MMRSYLTLHVFRQLIRQTLFSDAACYFRPLHQRRSYDKGVVKIFSPGQRRSLFGFSRKTQRNPKPINVDPGFALMVELHNMLGMGTRPPPPDELAKAFNNFFQARLKAPIPLENFQAQLVVCTFTHLQETYTQVEGFGLAEEDLRLALRALAHSLALHGKRQSLNKEMCRTHNVLGKLLFQELKQRRGKNSDRQEPQEPWSGDLLPFIQILTHSDDSLLARELVETHWHADLASSGRSPWVQILRGFAREDNGKELANTVEIMEKYKLPFDYKVHQSVTLYYARRGDMEMTKKWYNHPIADSQIPTAYTDASVLRLCIRQNELEWGDPIFKSLLERNPETSKEWNIIFQWAAAKGKGVDEIERMMKVMVRRNEDNEKSIHPDIETINGLIELANSKNDPYTAERYVALGQKWGFHPNAETYLLQLAYRINVGDLDGARAVYTRLQSQEISEDKDVPLINKLIVAMCAGETHDFEAIMGLAEDLSERKARFEPETVAALSRLHLERNEMRDLVDLLHTHVFHYGLDQRASIRNIFVEFCLDRSKSTSQAWDVYNVLRQIFAETDVEIRTNLMNEFFSRGRSDMACHVFGHMRQQPAGTERPTADTYVTCFEGIGKSGDAESLDTVYNMLKLDAVIEPSTRLYNSLMLAFMGCKQPRRGLEFWTDIAHSREGPTYNSIQIAFRVCEAAPFGDRHAREIWAKLKRNEIEITGEIYAAYIGAIAGGGYIPECVKLVDDIEKEIGYKQDALMFVISLSGYLSSADKDSDWVHFITHCVVRKRGLKLDNGLRRRIRLCGRI